MSCQIFPHKTFLLSRIKPFSTWEFLLIYSTGSTQQMFWINHFCHPSILWHWQIPFQIHLLWIFLFVKLNSPPSVPKQKTKSKRKKNSKHCLNSQTAVSLHYCLHHMSSILFSVGLMPTASLTFLAVIINSQPPFQKTKTKSDE